jgi:protein-S-isoprenylcysteine O-methyltransferase Ste14
VQGSDRLLGSLAMIGGLVAWLASGGIDVPPGSHMLSPRFFPRLLGVVLAALGATLFLSGKGRPLREIADKISRTRNYLLVGATLLYALLFGHADYRVLSPAYMASALWILGVREPGRIALISVCAPAALYMLFRYGFMVLLPSLG